MNNLSINFVTPKDKRKNTIVFIFWNDYLYRKEKYSGDFDYANELMYMTSMISNSMLYHNYDRIMCHDIEEALDIAKSAGFIHAFIQTPGNIIQKNIPSLVLDYINNRDYFLMGHILDGKPKNKYLWMHEQCFVMNLSHLNNFDYKINWDEKYPKLLQDYERSVENFHDDYTPHWVKGLANVSLFKSHDWSANWLNYGLKNNLLLVFNESIRNSKFHMYPENTNHIDTWRGLIQEQNQLSKILINSAKIDNQQHIFNNENFSIRSANAVKDNIDVLVVPASGFFSVHASKNFNPKKIIFYDIDQKTLDYRKAINDQWAPTKSLEDIEIDGLMPFNDIGISKIQLLDNEWFHTDEEVNLFWEKYKQIKKEYVCIDIIKDYEIFSKIIPNDSSVYVWLNSIYTYSINIWNHKPKTIFESYFGLIYSLKQNKNKIWVDCKEPTGQYRTFEIHNYIPDATMFGNANYRKYM